MTRTIYWTETWAYVIGTEGFLNVIYLFDMRLDEFDVVSPFNRWENSGSLKWSILPKDTKQTNHRAGIWTSTVGQH
jgi:hypothetical protein